MQRHRLEKKNKAEKKDKNSINTIGEDMKKVATRDGSINISRRQHHHKQGQKPMRCHQFRIFETKVEVGARIISSEKDEDEERKTLFHISVT
jgi:hypothetical protein